MRAWIWTLTVLAFVGAGLLVGRLRDTATPIEQGFFAVPPAPISHLAAGFDNIAADLMYMRFTVYWGYQLTHGRHFHNLYPMLDLITDLDPRFRPAYELGSFALGDAGQVKAAVELLNKGAKTQPQSDWYPYQAGIVLFMQGQDYLEAAHYFELAAQKPHARPSAAYFAARMYKEAGRTDLAIKTWQRVYVSAGNSSVRQVARNALRRLGKNTDVLIPKSSESVL